MFKLQLGHFEGDKKALEKTFEAKGEYDIMLKENTDIDSPTFLIKEPLPDVVLKSNYAYCDNLNRYYFVEKIITRTGRIQEVICKSDPLRSFRKMIQESRGIAESSQNKYNLYVQDDVFTIETKSLIGISEMGAKTDSTDANFVLIVAGGG